MASGRIQKAIQQKIQTALKPTHLEIINESYMHNVPQNSETHFKVIVISDEFNGKPLLQRHRLINELLALELQTGVHALSITSKTPEQWEKSNVVRASPNCLGGMARENANNA